MASTRSNSAGSRKTENSVCADRQQEAEFMQQMQVEVGSGGDWLSADELLEVAQAASQTGTDLLVNMNHIDHLDASALQVLLALAKEQKSQGKQMHLANGSSTLLKWFEYAGAANLIVADQQGHDEL